MRQNSRGTYFSNFNFRGTVSDLVCLFINPYFKSCPFSFLKWVRSSLLVLYLKGFPWSNTPIFICICFGHPAYTILYFEEEIFIFKKFLNFDLKFLNFFYFDNCMTRVWDLLEGLVTGPCFKPFQTFF